MKRIYAKNPTTGQFERIPNASVQPYNDAPLKERVGAVEAKAEQTATDIATKQEKLVSGQNIKTVQGQSLLGGGNVLIPVVGEKTPEGGETFGQGTYAPNHCAHAQGGGYDSYDVDDEWWMVDPSEGQDFSAPVTSCVIDWSNSSSCPKAGDVFVDEGTLSYHEITYVLPWSASLTEIQFRPAVKLEPFFELYKREGVALGQYSFVGGYGCNANKAYSHACGESLKAMYSNETVFGVRNYDEGEDTEIIDEGLENPLFVIGNGFDVSVPQDALRILRNGQVFITGIGDFNGQDNNYPKKSLQIVLGRMQQSLNRLSSIKTINGESLLGSGDISAMRPLFLQAGATWDGTNYTLNGVKLTESEMANTYNLSIGLRQATDWSWGYAFTDIVTNIPKRGGRNIDLFGAFHLCNKLKVASISNVTIDAQGSMSYSFDGCSQLTSILGNISCTNVTIFGNAFIDDAKLVSLKLSNIKADISFADSPLLSVDATQDSSVGYMILNAIGGSSDKHISITLHPDVFGKFWDYPELVAKAQEKFIDIIER